MGIPHYFRIITQQYPNILSTIQHKKCNHYFIDFNGLIHQAARKIIEKPIEEPENAIIGECWKYLESCIRVANPSLMVHVCTDGVAPIAKMNQQRKRRYLSVLHHELHNNKINWDTNAISPGTQFMIKLNNSMKSNIRDNKSKVIYYFSGSDENGEGEHKIFARLSSLKKEEVAYIYGLDADLIMLSLLSHHPNIYLMREPQHVDKNFSIDDEFVYLDIHTLRCAILKELKLKYKWPITDEVLDNPYSLSAKEKIESYIVLCFLLGNDFLPHIPSLSLKKNGHDRLLNAAKSAWNIYDSGLINLNNDTQIPKINLEFLLHVFQNLKDEENDIIKRMNEEYLKKNIPAEDPTSCYAIQSSNKDKLAYELYSNGFTKWRTMYYKHLFFTRMYDTKIIINSCKSYMTGIIWTYAYYKRMPKDNTWLYHYGYPPTVLDLSNYLSSSIDIWNNKLDEWKLNKKEEFVSSVVQLLCILPPQSSHLLLDNERSIMHDRKRGCVHLYPIKYKIQTYLKMHLWECTPVLPPIDIKWLLKCNSNLH